MLRGELVLHATVSVSALLAVLHLDCGAVGRVAQHDWHCVRGAYRAASDARMVDGADFGASA